MPVHLDYALRGYSGVLLEQPGFDTEWNVVPWSGPLLEQYTYRFEDSLKSRASVMRWNKPRDCWFIRIVHGIPIGDQDVRV